MIMNYSPDHVDKYWHAGFIDELSACRTFQWNMDEIMHYCIHCPVDEDCQILRFIFFPRNQGVPNRLMSIKGIFTGSQQYVNEEHNLPFLMANSKPLPFVLSLTCK